MALEGANTDGDRKKVLVKCDIHWGCGQMRQRKSF